MHPLLTPDLAERFASMTLRNLTRQYPYHPMHVLGSDADLLPPRVLHPVFYGCFDWHSAVHGYWQLTRLLRLFPDLPIAPAVISHFDQHLTASNIATELAYFHRPESRGFERPYGWAWLLMLAHERSLSLSQYSESGLGRGPVSKSHIEQWHQILTPLADLIEDRFLTYLPKATYPVRVGTHPNSAFALRLAADYCQSHQRHDLLNLLRDCATRWYLHDRDCNAWEPSQDDFLSSSLIEAECMRRLLPQDQFLSWFDAFLPHVRHGEPATLFRPAQVSDRTDGKIAHLDGLNFSRAWCWRSIATALPENDPLKQTAQITADQHLHASLQHISADYAGEHWLATFALLAMT